MSFPYKYIAIEGVIGAGKTTLAHLLGNHYKARLVLEEFANNTFLEKFYENPSRYAFSVEVGFLVERFQQMEVELHTDLFKPHVVSDYLFDKSFIFAKRNLEDAHYQIFKSLFEILSKRLPKPDILIYLYNNPSGLLNNIAKRGRPMEQHIKETYLKSLQEGYLQYLSYQPVFPVLWLDVSNCDFVVNENGIAQIINLLEQKFEPGLHKFEINAESI